MHLVLIIKLNISNNVPSGTKCHREPDVGWNHMLGNVRVIKPFRKNHFSERYENQRNPLIQWDFPKVWRKKSRKSQAILKLKNKSSKIKKIKNWNRIYLAIFETLIFSGFIRIFMDNGSLPFDFLFWKKSRNSWKMQKVSGRFHPKTSSSSITILVDTIFWKFRNFFKF